MYQIFNHLFQKLQKTLQQLIISSNFIFSTVTTLTKISLNRNETHILYNVMSYDMTVYQISKRKIEITAKSVEHRDPSNFLFTRDVTWARSQSAQRKQPTFDRKTNNPGQLGLKFSAPCCHVRG